MWLDTLKAIVGSVEAILLSLVAMATGIVSVIALVRGLLKRGEKDPKDAQITVGQEVDPEPRWITDLREDAAEADELRPRLTKALIRLARHGLPTDDI